jgi:hypothetical protein
MNSAEGIAPDVVAERVDLCSAADAVGTVGLPFHEAETIAGDAAVEKTWKDDDITIEIRASLLEEEAEGVARVEIDAVELHRAPLVETEHDVRHDLPAARDQRDAEGSVEIAGGGDDVAHVPDGRAVDDAQPSMRRPPCPRLFDAVELHHQMLEPSLGGDARKQQAAEHEGEADVERVVAGVDRRKPDDDGEEDERRADAREPDDAVELPGFHGHINVCGRQQISPQKHKDHSAA